MKSLRVALQLIKMVSVNFIFRDAVVKGEERGEERGVETRVERKRRGASTQRPSE